MARDAAAENARAEAELERQLATLALSVLPSRVAGAALQAVAWWNGLLRLGVAPPLVVVHDLGHLLSRPDLRREVLVAIGGSRLDFTPGGRYRALLGKVAACDTLDGLATAVLRDEVTVVLLARLLGDVWRGWAPSAQTRGSTSLPLTSGAYTQAPADLARRFDPEWVSGFLQRLAEEESGLLVRLEQLDVGVVRLFGLFPPGAAPPDVLDLYQALTSVGTSSVADFSLQLLPSLLETKRSLAAQRFAMDGYASVERRGSLDALLPSELALDADMFAQKAISDELLYYGHERPPETRRRFHGVLIDASASMRGVREPFARGLGIALAKKLFLMGHDVWLSFFDSRLHRRIEAGALGGKELPYLLTFRSEQGRNYGRVFEQLRAELQKEQRLRPRELAITFITHAECHVPYGTMEALSRLASLFGIFVLPSQPLAVDYLPVLRGHHVVSREALSVPAEKKRRALEIVQEVIGATGGPGR